MSFMLKKLFKKSGKLELATNYLIDLSLGLPFKENFR